MLDLDGWEERWAKWEKGEWPMKQSSARPTEQDRSKETPQFSEREISAEASGSMSSIPPPEARETAQHTAIQPPSDTVDTAAPTLSTEPHPPPQSAQSQPENVLAQPSSASRMTSVEIAHIFSNMVDKIDSQSQISMAAYLAQKVSQLSDGA